MEKQIVFKCKKCGCCILEEVMKNATVVSVIKNPLTIDENGELNIEYDDNVKILSGDVDYYQCSCGEILALYEIDELLESHKTINFEIKSV